MTARLAIVLVMLALGACRAPAAVAPSPSRPVLFIEGFRTTDSLSRQAASALRVRMARLRAERGWPLHVMTDAEIEAFLAAGSPDDFGGAWTWADVREAANVYRAYAVIDVIAVSVPAGVRLEPSLLHPVPHGSPTRLADVQAANLEAAVALLAERLAADSIVVQGKQGLGRRRLALIPTLARDARVPHRCHARRASRCPPADVARDPRPSSEVIACRPGEGSCRPHSRRSAWSCSSSTR